MGAEIDAGLFRNIFEVPVSVVLEQHIAAANGRDEQVLVAIVVNVAEGGGYADAARHSNAGFLSNVSEFPVSQVLPKLVASNLVDEVDVV